MNLQNSKIDILRRESYYPTNTYIRESIQNRLPVSSLINNNSNNISYQIIEQQQSKYDIDTLKQFYRSLKQAKTSGQRNITQKTQITNVINNVFALIKQILKTNQKQQFFDEMFMFYIDLLKYKQNSQHFFSQVELHLKQLLGNDYLKYKRNKKLYLFISRLFPYCPHTLYKVMQNKIQFFQYQIPQVIQIYRQYIRYAAQRKNYSLILTYLKNQLSIENTSIEKLTILLYHYKQKLVIQTIQSIQIKIDKLIQYKKKYFHEANTQKKLINLINQFLSLQWPLQANKYNSIIKYINNLKKDPNIQREKAINKIIKYLPIMTNNQIKDIPIQISNMLKQNINEKLMNLRASENIKVSFLKDYNQTFVFINILIEKLGRSNVENIIRKQNLKRTIQNLLLLPFPLKEGLINLLSILKKLNIHDLGADIQRRLIQKINILLSDEKNYFLYTQDSQLNYKVDKKNQQFIPLQSKTTQQLIYCIKALRYFNFNHQSFWIIYSKIKRFIFKKKIIIAHGFEFKKQVVKACLYIISKVQNPQQCKDIITDTIDIIGQQQSLKILFIEWSSEYDQFYKKKLYQVYNTQLYLQNLMHDFSSKNIVIKRFSIKVLCMIYPYSHQCEIIPFLKKTYYQIYQRLAVRDLVEENEKKIGLKLIRQIIRHRPQIVADDSQQFSLFLYQQLGQVSKYNNISSTHILSQHNLLTIQIFKTLISIMKCMTKSIYPYIKSIGRHIVQLINSKITSQQIKRIAIQTFYQMTYNCGFVILPYFYYKDLLFIFREILKSDDRNRIYRNQLMRFIGSLGYVSRQKYTRLIKLTTDKIQDSHLNSFSFSANNNLLQVNFQKTFKQINYLKQIKSLPSIKQTKPLPATSPYYSYQKIYKTTVQNFNYKQFIIEKVLKNMNQQSSSIIFYNTFKTLEMFIFILNKSQQKMYQNLVFQKILTPIIQNYNGKQIFPLSNMLSLFSKIIFNQQFKQFANNLFSYFFKHLQNKQKRTIILQGLFKISQKYPDVIKIDMKLFLLQIRKVCLQTYYQKFSNLQLQQIKKNNFINFNQNNLQQISQQIRLSFGIINNLSKQVDNYLHLFLPDFNDIFLKKPQQICVTYFCLLFNLFKHSPTIELFLSEISEHLYNLLKSQLQKLIMSSSSKIKVNSNNNNKLKGSKSYIIGQNSRVNILSFIQKIINFLISVILIYGDKFKPFIQNFHLLIKSNINRNYYIFYQIVQDFMKNNSSLNNLHYAFTYQQLNQIMRFQNLTITCIQQQQYQKKHYYKHQSRLNFDLINQMLQMFNCNQNQLQQQSQQWFSRLSIIMFQRSQQPFIRACSNLIKQDKTLCNDLFQMAFYFFWSILSNQFRRRLTMKLKNILENKAISLRVKQKFIDTIYYMEQCHFPIQLTDKLLCQASSQVLDLAKSLFYMEKLFEYDPQVHGESLIKMYAQMGQTQSAVGLMNIVQNLNTKTKIVLYQKLNRYRQALRQHENIKDKTKFQNIQLQIKIRRDMFQWQSVLNKCQKLQKHKSKISDLAVQAAINLGKWDQVKKHLPYVDSNHEKSNLWKAMVSIYDKKYQDVQKLIKKDRQLIYPKVCQLFNFSYQRKMQGVIRLQTLTELEEANDYLKLQKVQNGQTQQERKKLKNVIQNKRKLIQTLWNDRIQGANTNLWSMQQLLLSRSLLLSKAEDIQNWISYCKLALKENQPQLCKKTIQSLINQIKDPKKLFTVQTLLVQCKFTLRELRYQQAVNQIQKLIEEKGTSGSHHEYYYKCAIWLNQKQYDFTIQKAKKSIQLLNHAVKSFKTYIKGWHLLGLMHNKIIQLYETRKKSFKVQRRASNILSSSKEFDQLDLTNLNKGKQTKDKQNDSKQLRQKKQKQQDPRQYHIFQALRSFIKSVSCGVKNHQFFLQDCLKIMNIIFTEHQVEGLLQQLRNTYIQIPSDGLIEIIPQIIGRLDIFNKPLLLDIMKKFLIHIGTNHPQAIIFPLIFCKKCNNPTKKSAAEQIFKQLAKASSSKFTQIAEDAQKITQQLCKVSLKLNEKFYILVSKALQKSRQKGICTKNIAFNYVNIIEKILAQDQNSLSISQFGFIQQYNQDLIDIKRKLIVYIQHNQSQFFKRAQKKICNILNALQKTLNQTKKIFLQQLSPVLFNIDSTKVCLFGSYNPNRQPIYIQGFKNQLNIVLSKQRPKKIIITGSNGKDYNFLLKGKQDLRLDQRIMQLFSLINKMFHDPSQRQNYSIMGYSITPISLQIGIISWVQNCDTIGQLITKQRSSSNVYFERQISSQICKLYSILPKAQKVQIYKQIQTRVSGTDLRNIFWTRSSSSQQWLKNRTCFTRSLAVMSIVGYIIGLGDRHPNNIMIQRDTGQIVHIDFGDCFDVNKMRKQYPERVPFRLTRMLVKAMEPCGVHGIFKHTCQKIIKLLRSNKQSIIAIVEAFRYDPLIGWRLVKDQDEQEGMLQHSFEDNQISFITKLGQKQRKPQKKPNNTIDFAQHILNQIKKKLNGRLFQDSTKIMSPEEQVAKLIQQAMSPENLVQHYEGWQIYW